MEYYRLVVLLLSTGIIFGTIYAIDSGRDVYAVNATEFLMNVGGFLNTSFSFGGPMVMPNITGQDTTMSLELLTWYSKMAGRAQ